MATTVECLIRQKQAYKIFKWFDEHEIDYNEERLGRELLNINTYMTAFYKYNIEMSDEDATAFSLTWGAGANEALCHITRATRSGEPFVRKNLLDEFPSTWMEGIFRE